MRSDPAQLNERDPRAVDALTRPERQMLCLTQTSDGHVSGGGVAGGDALTAEPGDHAPFSPCSSTHLVEAVQPSADIADPQLD